MARRKTGKRKAAGSAAKQVSGRKAGGSASDAAKPSGVRKRSTRGRPIRGTASDAPAAPTRRSRRLRQEASEVDEAPAAPLRRSGRLRQPTPEVGEEEAEAAPTQDEEGSEGEEAPAEAAAEEEAAVEEPVQEPVTLAEVEMAVGIEFEGREASFITRLQVLTDPDTQSRLAYNARYFLVRAVEAANVEAADVEAADVEGANVEAANVEGANVEAANVEGADVEGADVEGADVDEANVEAANVETEIGLLNSWRFDKRTAARPLARAEWIEDVLTPDLTSPPMPLDLQEAAMYLQALYEKDGNVQPIYANLRTELQENSLIFIEMILLYDGFRGAGLLKHVMDGYNALLARLPEWFAFEGSLILVPGKPTKHAEAWNDMDAGMVTERLVVAYQRRGYTVWAPRVRIRQEDKMKGWYDYFRVIRKVVP
ncbi:hypothetical protein LTR85_003023 [Meristemomyces frigidus]|nr:hypothetical protein LTR85_003023 [Meristemomyces frigidus]